MTRVSVSPRQTLAALVVLPFLLAGCGDVARTGRSPVLLVVDSLTAASGADPGSFGGGLRSDVLTIVEQQINGQTVRVPTTFNDIAQVEFRLIPKNPGTPANPLEPSLLNEVTISRYRVVFRRTDGRNTPGVDVPHGFDGAFTVTVRAGDGAGAGFELVRHTAKAEPPLRNLAYGSAGIFINTIAEVTFYGADQAGNEVQATASISVNFADFGDPD